jgi:hypothetical protein
VAVLRHDELRLKRHDVPLEPEFVVPPLRARDEQCAQCSLIDRKYSVPSSAIRTRPCRRRNSLSPPVRSSVPMTSENTGKNRAGSTGSSMARIWLSHGIAVMPNRLWQFDWPRPCSRWR